MFKNAPQVGPLCVLSPFGSKPLQTWCQTAKNGHIKRVTDEEILSMTVEVAGANVSTTFITCPSNPKQTLGIKLPILVMIVKIVKRDFSFELQLLDDANVRRRFRASTYLNQKRESPALCAVPLDLKEGWNRIQFDISEFTRHSYGTNYTEALRLQINANCRIRSVYFLDTILPDDELRAEFKLPLPAKKWSSEEVVKKQ